MLKRERFVAEFGDGLYMRQNKSKQLLLLAIMRKDSEEFEFAQFLSGIKVSSHGT